MEKQGVIYKIENTVNGKMYFGQTRQTFQKREYAHLNLLRKNKHSNAHLQSAWNKYGEQAFKFEIVERCSIEELNISEGFWIDLYDTMNRTYGYNLMDGGGVGTKVSEETRQKLIAFQMAQRAKKVICLNDLKVYNSLKEAASAYGLFNSQVSQVVRGEHKSAGNYVFEYYDESKTYEMLSDEYVFERGCRKVICLNDLKVYNSVSDAGDAIGATPSMVSKVCRKEQPHTKGYKFEFYDENKTYRIEGFKKVSNAKKPVFCVTTQQIFKSVSEAAREMQVDAGSIVRACKGQIKTAGKNPNNRIEGLRWKYIDIKHEQLQLAL